MNDRSDYLYGVGAVKPPRVSGKIHIQNPRWHNQLTLCGIGIAPNWKELSPYYDNVEINCKTCLSYIGFSLPAKMWFTHTANKIKARKIHEN